MVVNIPDEFRGSVFNLSMAFICMRMNGTPHYERVKPEHRASFEHFVSTGALTDEVEHLKHDAAVEAAAAELSLSDQVMSEFSTEDVQLRKPLPPAVQNRLGLLIDQLQVLCRRLEACRTLAVHTRGEADAHRITSKIASLMRGDGARQLVRRGARQQLAPSNTPLQLVATEEPPKAPEPPAVEWTDYLGVAEWSKVLFPLARTLAPVRKSLKDLLSRNSAEKRNRTAWRVAKSELNEEQRQRVAELVGSKPPRKRGL